MSTAERIYGEEVFFKFIEIPSYQLKEGSDLAQQIKEEKIHGFIATDVFSKEEIEGIKEAIKRLPETDRMDTPSGNIFPAPFAIMSDSGEMVNQYYNRLQKFYDFAQKEPAIKNMLTKMDAFFKKAGGTYKVSIPSNKIRNAKVSPGTLRFFLPNMGGLQVHCGNLFQAQSMHYYSLIENDIDMDDQLSFFLVIQQPEQGGELTIYDMLWKDVKRKVHPENNEYVINDKGENIYLKDVRSFSVNPKPGDILIFSGGPIWHRVENIKGDIPRMTFGGFLNFSKDAKELYYWS